MLSAKEKKMAVTLVRDLIIDRGNLRGESNFLISPLSYRRHFPFESVAIAAPLSLSFPSFSRLKINCLVEQK